MPIPLRLYSDFVCPFCFVAEQSTVPRLLAEFDLELDWYGFELHPSTPPGGVPLSKLFPGVPLGPLHERTERFAASFGVTGLKPPDWLWNSRKALAMRFATSAGGVGAAAMIPVFVAGSLKGMLELSRPGHAFRRNDLVRAERIAQRALLARN